MSWLLLALEAPEIAANGRRLLYRTETGHGLLATVRLNATPRIHVVWVAIVDNRLVTFVTPSAKLRDLEGDGRYALHNEVDVVEPSEFMVRGRALPIVGEERAAIAASWYYKPSDDYGLFELDIEEAHYGDRASEDVYPPIYSRWKRSS